MDSDVIIVGGGIAGLTAAGYLSKAGYSTLLCEKENACGGLVNTFTRHGFVFDGGIRAIENSGVVFPMLKHLGVELEFLPNHVSLGIEDRVVRVNSEDSVLDYHALLNYLYPENVQDIERIITEIRKIMNYMKVQYGIDNPIFLDIKKDRDYLLKTILPWAVKYALTVPRISPLSVPVVEFLKRYTQNQSLLDIIAQHFFQETPAFFALSYFKLYLDYHYPLGGTGKLIEKMIAFIQSHQGQICTGIKIEKVDAQNRVLTDANGVHHQYRKLIWAADLISFYNMISIEKLDDQQMKSSIRLRQAEITGKRGNDSVLTVFLAVNLDKNYFAEKSSEHFFYTPSRLGQSQAGPLPVNADRIAIETWLKKFFSLTTFEISCPVMRDASLAPPGKTGLVISVLFDYQITRWIEEQGWYEEFKAFCEQEIINTLDGTIYPGLREAVLHVFSSTPITMERLAGNFEGAITGWSFTNRPIPAESRLPRIMKAVRTPLPGVYQAGQWTYSPSGLPISILTGKIAADGVIKELAKGK